MNRELKFRAWLPSIKKMTHSLTLWGWSKTLQSGDLVNYDVQPDVVFMQFTGLHDKNGKEIYEGDIIRLIKNEGLPTEETVIYSIRWGAWCLMKQRNGDIGNGFSFDAIEARSCEIIGNIYENPELFNPTAK